MTISNMPASALAPPRLSCNAAVSVTFAQLPAATHAAAQKSLSHCCNALKHKNATRCDIFAVTSINNRSTLFYSKSADSLQG